MLGFSSLAILPLKKWNPILQFSQAERLGRVTVGMAEVKTKPDADSTTISKVYEDEVLPWLREVIGRRPYRRNQRWVETPGGYIWLPYLQPVKDLPNELINFLPETSLGAGMWVEVTVPFVDLILANPPARSTWLQEDQIPRLY